MRGKTPWNRKKRRVGRGVGSGRGKTSGRGHKGCGARSGWRPRWGNEGGQNPYYMRFPKRGFTQPFKATYDVVNLDTLVAWSQAKIGVDEFRLRGLLKNKNAGIKVLARGGAPKKPIVVEAHAFSRTAREQIEKAGGQAITLKMENRATHASRSGQSI